MGMVELLADLIKEGADVNEKDHVSLKRVVRDGLSGAEIFGIWRYWVRVRGL